MIKPEGNNIVGSREMMAAQPFKNAVLGALHPAERDILFDRLLTKPIQAGEVLYEPGAPLIHMIFPHSGIISMQAILTDGRTIEKASVGRDSFVGIEYVLGERISPCHAVVTIPGQASWLSTNDFESIFANSEALRAVMMESSLRLVRNLMHAVVCASVHSASQRVATWLLRAQDRSDTNQFDLTQRTLANIFGLRLATISDACARLHAAGAIDQARGALTIVDREKLMVQACECYEKAIG